MTIEELKELKTQTKEIAKNNIGAHAIFDAVDWSADVCALINAEIARQSVTSEEGHCWYCIGIESHGIAAVKTVTDEYGYELGGYDTPYNFCPNCGRRLEGEEL